MAILINCTPKSSLEMPRVEEVKARRQRLAADFPDRLMSNSAFQINDCGSITCDNCKIKSTKVCCCVGCKMFMCPSCLAAHEILQVTFEGHIVISAAEIRPELYEVLLERENFCLENYHLQLTTNYFCLNCQSCICPYCVVTTHREHKLLALDEAAYIKFTAASEAGQRLGYILTEEIDLNLTTLEGLDETLVAGVKAVMMLCPKTTEGNTINQPDLKGLVEVLIEPAPEVADLAISDKKDGKLEIHFTPKVPGAYSIEVKISGDRLLICPASVEVTENEVGQFNIDVLSRRVSLGI